MATRKRSKVEPNGYCGICGQPVEREGARLCFTCRTWNRRELTPAHHIVINDGRGAERHSVDIRPEY